MERLQGEQCLKDHEEMRYAAKNGQIVAWKRSAALSVQTLHRTSNLYLSKARLDNQTIDSTVQVGYFIVHAKYLMAVVKILPPPTQVLHPLRQ